MIATGGTVIVYLFFMFFKEAIKQITIDLFITIFKKGEKKIEKEVKEEIKNAGISELSTDSAASGTRADINTGTKPAESDSVVDEPK